MKMYQFEKLDIWQQSLTVVKVAYKITKEFPKEEQYSLSNQIQRAAVSISLNIAEGRGSESQKEFIKYLNISLKSLYEVVAGFKIAIELGYLKSENKMYIKFSEDIDSLGARIRSLIKKVDKDKNAKSQ
jgi:four helix bundle protein